MHETVKIVFTGAVGSGKTAAIRALSEIPVVSTDVYATDAVQHTKEFTTAAMDYGEVSLDEGTTLALYGTPGQQRYDFMWRILVKGAIGLVIMVDNSGPDPIADLAGYLRDFAFFTQEHCAVIAVTHRDVAPQPALDEYRRHLQQHGHYFPVFGIDARDRDQVLLLIESLMAMLETWQGA